MKLVHCVVLICSLSICSCLNILGIFPYEGKSHFIVFRVLLEELSNRGHNVTVISHFPSDTKQMNYNDISLTGSSIDLEGDGVFLANRYLVLLKTAYFLASSGVKNCEDLLGNQEVKKLWESKPEFDVIIVEQFNSDCALGLAHKIGGPVVSVTSHIFMPWHYNRFGVPYNPSYVPFHFLEGGTKPNIFQRVERTVFDFLFNSLYKYYCQRRDQNTLAEYFDDIPPLEELAKNIKFMLVYTNFPLTGSRLYPANVIEVGGYHVSKPKALSKELTSFIEESKHGIIYISFGSFIKASLLPDEKLNAILEAISELPQRVIWKFDNKTKVNKYKNIYSAAWLPQNDILAHPKTLAFFSHCGNGGTTEAIHHGVPMVGMPVLGDQPANAASIEESGLGVYLRYEDLTKDKLLETFRKVLDPKFHKQVKKLSQVWHDRTVSAIDTAVYWTEFAARHKEFSFRSASADVPTYQYLGLDVLLIISTALIFFIAVLKFSLSSCCKSKSLPKGATISKKKTKSKKL